MLLLTFWLGSVEQTHFSFHTGHYLRNGAQNGTQLQLPGAPCGCCWVSCRPWPQGTLTFIYAGPVEGFGLLHCWDVIGAGGVEDI